MENYICVEDIEKDARKILDKSSLEFVASGSDDEITLKESKSAFQRWLIRPRVLREVTQRNLKTVIFGKPIEFPVGISPTAIQKLWHPDGEIAMAKACESMGIIYTLSTVSTTSIEDIQKAAPNCRKWFQVYVFKNRKETEDLISRAEKANFEAIVITVDALEIGRRRSNLRQKFKLPSHLNLANFEVMGPNDFFFSKLFSSIERNLTWEDIALLRTKTNLKIILKGIFTAESARQAIKYGVHGIFLSTHGGRQQDNVLPTIDSFEEIVQVVQGRCEIFIDGGFTKGSDVFKAIALGAKMAFLGRAPIWGLCLDGQKGVEKVLEIIKNELDLTMALSGTPDIDLIKRDSVMKIGHSKL